MGIEIDRVRIDSVTLSKDTDGKEKMEGRYSLMSGDRAVANQSFGGYGDKLDTSTETKKTLSMFLKNLETDIDYNIGLKQAVDEAIEELKKGKK